MFIVAFVAHTTFATVQPKAPNFQYFERYAIVNLNYIKLNLYNNIFQAQVPLSLLRWTRARKTSLRLRRTGIVPI